MYIYIYIQTHYLMLRHKLRTSLLLLPQLQTTLFRHTWLDAFMLQSAEPQGLRPLAWAKKDSEVLRRLQRHTSETRKNSTSRYFLSSVLWLTHMFIPCLIPAQRNPWNFLHERRQCWTCRGLAGAAEESKPQRHTGGQLAPSYRGHGGMMEKRPHDNLGTKNGNLRKYPKKHNVKKCWQRVWNFWNFGPIQYVDIYIWLYMVSFGQPQ